MSNILSVGDILEIRLPSGVAYASYGGRDEALGDAIWVVPRVFPTPVDGWSSVFGDEGYFVFYPAHSAIRQKLVRRAGHAIEAMRLVPTGQRTAGRVDEQGNVAEWLITEGATRTRRSASEMTERDWALPLAVVWNHAYLVEAIAEDRRPGQRRA